MATRAERKTWTLRWKASGLSAREFAGRHGLKSKDLYNWAVRLGMTGASKQPLSRPREGVQLLRVVPRTHGAEDRENEGRPSGLRLTVGGAFIDVQTGFDEATLRKVMAAMNFATETER